MKLKNTLLAITLTLTAISCKAQIIAVENYHNYNKELDDGAYIKDINNVLNKFVGTWKGTYNNKNYEFRIVKNTKNFKTRPSIKKDEVLMCYKITDNNGTIIENTLTLTNDSPFVMKNGYIDRDGGYVFSYIGRDVACGQNGWVFTQVYGNNNKKLQLFLQVEGENYPSCTTGEAKQILPTKSIELNKQ